MQVNEEYKVKLYSGNVKIYESPDKGKTVFERDFGADPSTRTVVKTSVQQQWNITFNGAKVDL